MSRNMKPDYLKKLLHTETPNGYKFDIANYLHNPSYDCEYPAFHKTVSEDETTRTICRVYYFKYYNGTGEYIREVFSVPTSKGGWAVTRSVSKEILETSNRFNLNKLISFC